MANGGSLTESLWRDLIADEVGYWLESHPNFKHSELLDYILTGTDN